MEDKNICMYCGKKSKNKMKFRVIDKKEIFRDFCSNECLVEYYMLTIKKNATNK